MKTEAEIRKEITNLNIIIEADTKRMQSLCATDWQDPECVKSYNALNTYLLYCKERKRTLLWVLGLV